MPRSYPLAHVESALGASRITGGSVIPLKLRRMVLS